MKSVQAYYKNLEKTQKKTKSCVNFAGVQAGCWMVAVGMILETMGNQNLGTF